MIKPSKGIVVISISLLALALLSIGGPKLLQSYQSRCRNHPPPSALPIDSEQNGKITISAQYRDALSQTRKDGLAIIAPDGFVEQFIVADTGAGYPSWSSDGTQLAFSAYPNHSSSLNEIFVLDMQTGSVRQLAREGVSDGNPDVKQQILVLDITTGSVRQLTWEGVSNSDPDWTPEAKQLVYVGEIDNPGETTIPGDGNKEIYVIDPDGSVSHRLTTHEATDFSPEMAPDGNAIIFVSNRDGDNEIYKMDPTGRNIEQLTTDGGSDVDPAWSPDGKWIVFASNRSGQWEIYTMQQNGSNQCPLTNSLSVDREPAWAPDGHSIVFVSDNALAIVRADGTGEQHILQDDRIQNIQNPTWQSDP